ncbi:MAG: hypothetical protein OXI87_24780 [Albidovulum sp.]|nr:hypothetical protein [Albidovulum sp.]
MPAIWFVFASGFGITFGVGAVSRNVAITFTIAVIFLSIAFACIWIKKHMIETDQKNAIVGKLSKSRNQLEPWTKGRK